MPGLFVREQIVQNLRALSPDNLAKHLQMKQARMSEIEYQYSQAKSGNEIWEARKLVEEDREIRNEIWEARELMKEKAEEKQKEKANENEKTETVKEKEKENEGKEEDEVGSVSPWESSLGRCGSPWGMEPECGGVQWSRPACAGQPSEQHRAAERLLPATTGRMMRPNQERP